MPPIFHRAVIGGIALLLPLLFPQQVVADAADDLIARLAPFQSLSGDFRQAQYREGSDEPRVSTGSFQLLRPGYFTWDIESPESQLILATPAYVWQYDRDLDTVSRRPVGGEGEMSPLQVLGGDEAALRDDYSISAEVGEGGADFELIPNSDGAGFRALILQFRGAELSGMRITDNLGQRIEVSFSAVVRNAGLSESDFSFTPPPEADLFYHD